MSRGGLAAPIAVNMAPRELLRHFSRMKLR